MPRGVWLAPCFYRNPSAPRLSAELPKKPTPESPPRGGVWGCPASNLYVSSRGRGEQSGLRGRGQRPQGLGSQATQTAQRTAAHAGREGGGPHEKAARSATRRVVHLAVSVRPTSPEQNRTQDPVAHHPWFAP